MIFHLDRDSNYIYALHKLCEPTKFIYANFARHNMRINFFLLIDFFPKNSRGFDGGYYWFIMVHRLDNKQRAYGL
jgi:hypothetical protein